MSSEPSNGTFSGTHAILMLAKAETHIQQLLEYVGLPSDGPVILRKIKASQNGHTIDITLTVSCARNWDTVQTTVDSLRHLLRSREFLSASSETSNSNISAPSQPTDYGKGTLIPLSELREILSASPDERDGLWGVEIVQIPYATP